MLDAGMYQSTKGNWYRSPSPFRRSHYLLSAEQTAEPALRLGRLLLDRLVELVYSSIELLARLLEFLLGASLELVEPRLGPLRFGFCVIGLMLLAQVSIASKGSDSLHGRSGTLSMGLTMLCARARTDSKPSSPAFCASFPRPGTSLFTFALAAAASSASVS